MPNTLMLKAPLYLTARVVVLLFVAGGAVLGSSWRGLPPPTPKVASLRCTHPLKFSFQYKYRKDDNIVLVRICG